MNVDQSFLDKIRGFFGLPLSTDAGQPNAPVATGVPLVKKQMMPPADNASWTEKYAYQKQQYQDRPNDFVHGYRYNNKTGSLESLPSFFEKRQFEPFLEAYKASKKHGNVEVSPDDFAALMLQEGRYDFGFNKFDYDTAPKKAKEIYDKLKKEGYPDRAAGFAALLNEKHQVAKRLNIPIPMAWNGTGMSKAGQTGREYSKKVQKTKELLNHPKNQPVREYFQKTFEPRAELESLDYNDPFGDSIG